MNDLIVLSHYHKTVENIFLRMFDRATYPPDTGWHSFPDSLCTLYLIRKRQLVLYTNFDAGALGSKFFVLEFLVGGHIELFGVLGSAFFDLFDVTKAATLIPSSMWHFFKRCFGFPFCLTIQNLAC